MQEQKRIIQLIEQLLSNQASGREKEELFHLLNSGMQEDQINNWLKENWEKTEHAGIDIPSGVLLEKIHQQIGITKTNINKSIDRKIQIRKLVRTTLKYAAVCIVACGIEWYFLTQKDITDNNTVVQTIQYNEITVPTGSKSYVVLADSTKVWLNAGAKLRYPSNFRENYREVFLEGEAFFDVSKNKDMPFFVNMAGMNIKVLGTQFNVKAYTDEKSIETTLVEGSIEVVGLRSDKQDESNLQLKPGQKLILTKDKSFQSSAMSQQNQAEDASTQKDLLIKIKNAEIITLHDTKPETAWTEDKLIFYKERFDNVKIKLERWYGVTIDIQDPEILDYRFTGTFDEETFEQALLALKKAARFDYQIKKKHVTIKPI
ncbi:MAG: hypothetical protein A2W90_01040 [Bacteroidetes bacterium GWF2_42_66]|nr:MAG: hypothetical protein A2W92_00460 [Bacteroidetes bacterium GWA2_42_15]OFY00969.1 MAG: hypothetical protein A2W89_14530 [Bacteroidetes bacterium GWE2_42_39]OFY41809.1 MAG: hypothetical protein A2W90_01040 [Bacteroidetes bacterium GWF2_42_66]HBL78023.1 hypothetical protein [Prolixibacteraceae bacterium]HCR89845.1 hypothetical protein [Prolixibacteraceae bacterium]